MPLDIPLVGDGPGDVRLMQQAVQASNLAIHLHGLRTNCHLSKPAFPDALDRMVDSINDFWLTKAQLPSIATSIQDRISLGGIHTVAI